MQVEAAGQLLKHGLMMQNSGPSEFELHGRNSSQIESSNHRSLKSGSLSNMRCQERTRSLECRNTLSLVGMLLFLKGARGLVSAVWAKGSLLYIRFRGFIPGDKYNPYITHSFRTDHQSATASLSPKP